MTRHWLSAERIRLYAAAILAVYLAAAATLLLRLHGGVDAHGYPLGSDFIAYWGASHAALGGDAPGAYDPPLLLAAERAAVPGFPGGGPWLYPPGFFLLIAPLALLPYFWALALFLAAGLVAYALVARRILPGQGATLLLPLLAFPGTAINLIQGQNGFLTAALLGGGLLLLPAWPLAAGLLLGLLSIKPQLAVLLPLALAAGGYWRSLLAAALSALLLNASGVLLLGGGTMHGFLAAAQAFSATLPDDLRMLGRVPTLFAALRLLGLPAGAAYAGQALLALGAAALVVWSWRRSRDPALRGAVLVAATLLSSPYLLNYDLTWLALAIAWYTAYALRRGWRRGERELLLLAWLLPLAMALVHGWIGLQLAPLLPLALLTCLWRRLRYDSAAA